ncbi:hypothetical protein GGX14DRAFT_391534 [Mycena pura]|uniref:Uncharacterized protein n=1 Tax=Mycena pura TaxID=153505 RepID=A0AAD6VLK3_9AGAR|nr:hypothetical protein GGX14DRAFT_391534 [Mycena pura]
MPQVNLRFPTGRESNLIQTPLHGYCVRLKLSMHGRLIFTQKGYVFNSDMYSCTIPTTCPRDGRAATSKLVVRNTRRVDRYKLLNAFKASGAASPARDGPISS